MYKIIFSIRRIFTVHCRWWLNVLNTFRSTFSSHVSVAKDDKMNCLLKNGKPFLSLAALQCAKFSLKSRESD